jgi:uncharacterized membrane protein YedE/YeeE
MTHFLPTFYLGGILAAFTITVPQLLEMLRIVYMSGYLEYLSFKSPGAQGGARP